MSAPFVSVADLGTFLSRDDIPDDPTTLAMAVIALDSACEIVRGYTHQYLNYVEDDEVTLDGTGTDALLLPQLPALDVTEVLEDDGTELVEGTDHVVGFGGILWRIDGLKWTLGKQNITVTYSHGWGLEEPGSGDVFERMPSDIRIIALTIAARRFHSGVKARLTGVQSETIGNYSYQRFADADEVGVELTEREMAVLDRYRVRRAA